jgi:hypothetical protein
MLIKWGIIKNNYMAAFTFVIGFFIGYLAYEIYWQIKHSKR